VALQLKKKGIARVRPLAGGYIGWRDKGYPLMPFYSQKMVEAPGASASV
jgi:rhodanese-related sulfurtransferase